MTPTGRADALRMSVSEIAHKLRDEIQERVATAGVEVIEARITHLSYARSAMSLRRQRTNAIIAPFRVLKAPSAWSKWRWNC
jgi:malate/lactate dehydrogenase